MAGASAGRHRVSRANHSYSVEIPMSDELSPRPYPDATRTTTYTCTVDDGPRPRFEHDPAARVYRLAAADGTIEVFRDNPTRYLCVEPDPDGGEMRPVTKGVRPVYFYLC